MSSAPTLHKFAVFAPDAESALARRLEVRPQHLEGANKLWEDGKIKIGGALLTEDSLTTGERKFYGSFMVYEAETIDEVRKTIENDPYYINNVWDKSRLLILPWLQAFPK